MSSYILFSVNILLFKKLYSTFYLFYEETVIYSHFRFHKIIEYNFSSLKWHHVISGTKINTHYLYDADWFPKFLPWTSLPKSALFTLFEHARPCLDALTVNKILGPRLGTIRIHVYLFMREPCMCIRNIPLTISLRDTSMYGSFISWNVSLVNYIVHIPKWLIL